MKTQRFYRAADLDRLIEEHKEAYPKFNGWKVPEHPRAECRVWLLVDGERGPVTRNLPGQFKKEDPLKTTLHDLSDGVARWVQIRWRASYANGEWTFLQGEGWRNVKDDETDGFYVHELNVNSCPLLALEFMRDLDLKTKPGTEAALDRILGDQN